MNRQESEVALLTLLRKELKTRKLVVSLRRVDEVRVDTEALLPKLLNPPGVIILDGVAKPDLPAVVQVASGSTNPGTGSSFKADYPMTSQGDGSGSQQFHDILDHLRQRKARRPGLRLLQMANEADKECRTRFPFTSLMKNVTADPKHGLPTPEVIDIYLKGSRVVREEHLLKLSPPGRAKLARLEKNMLRMHPAEAKGATVSFDNSDFVEVSSEESDTTVEGDDTAISGDSDPTVEDDDAIDDDAAGAPEPIILH